jgi:ribose-phosphate pyrophosphokinase
MKEINLAYPDKSEIKYKISGFPDGQQDIVITEETILEGHDVQIVSRFNSFQDLELIACTKAALTRLGVDFVSLFIPYLLGARSDREFQEGGTSYLVDIIGPFLNVLKFNRVVVMDVHSDVASACIHRMMNINNTGFVDSVLNGLYSGKTEDYYLVSPDAGSFKKLHKLADKIDYNKEIIICSKTRAVDGKLSNVIVPIDLKHSNSDLIIIDDICDGGATFLNIAKEIKKAGTHKGKLYLIVTHGIFSKGFSELAQYFDGIFCTNSVKDIPIEEVNKVQQFNII